MRGASLRNLQGMDVPIPLGRLTVISGVSGSGKSTFVEDVLVASLEAGKALGCAAIDGPRLRPVMVDQSPIGINPRSNAATYTGLADVIRDLFAGAERAFAVAFFVQPPGRRLPDLRRDGRGGGAHALPAFHLDPLRGLRRAALFG